MDGELVATIFDGSSCNSELLVRINSYKANLIVRPALKHSDSEHFLLLLRFSFKISKFFFASPARLGGADFLDFRNGHVTVALYRSYGH